MKDERKSDSHWGKQCPTQSRAQITLRAQITAVEVKNVRRIEQRHTDQLRVYLHDGGWPVGLLLNFGGKEPYHRRLYEPRHDPEKQGNA